MEIVLNDSHVLRDELDSGIKQQIAHRMNAGPIGTEIQIVDRATGKIIETVHNKVCVPGSQLTACYQWGLNHILEVPTYNTMLKLDQSEKPYRQDPDNDPIISLWSVGRSGCGPSGEVLVVSNSDRIEPVGDILPFRYVKESEDLDEDHRKIYYGRKTILPVDDVIEPFEEREYTPCDECAECNEDCQQHCNRYKKFVQEETERREQYDQMVKEREEEIAKMEKNVAYYFKKFDTDPMLHIRYLDGTEVLDNMYSVDAQQQIQIYVQVRLAISKQDFREAFDKLVGWDDSNVSTISLVTAWFKAVEEESADDPNEVATHKYYQDILPFSKFNFRNIDLSDLTKAVDFIYNVYY